MAVSENGREIITCRSQLGILRERDFSRRTTTTQPGNWRLASFAVQTTAMRNRATTPLGKVVGSFRAFACFSVFPARPFFFFLLPFLTAHILTHILYRKSDNHGASTICTISLDWKTPLPWAGLSFNKSGPPNQPLGHTTENRSRRSNGNACSRGAFGASCP